MGKDDKARQSLAERSRAELVERISEAMEEEGLAWAACWEGCWSPRNATTGRPYAGINRLSLAAAGAANGFKDPRWCTYKQAKEAGWRIRRGTKTTATVEFWSWYVRLRGPEGVRVVTLDRAKRLFREGRASPEDVLDEKFLKGSAVRVFNAEQVGGVPAIEFPSGGQRDAEVERIADEFIASSRCEVLETESDEAFYAPKRDSITLPLRSQFESMDGFCRTLLHEMSHSTARAVERKVASGVEGYAFEELVAEIGSVFCAADAGLDVDALANARLGQIWLENHAAYLKGWSSWIREDPGALARAASLASKSSDYIASRRESLLESREKDPSRGIGLTQRAEEARDAADALARPIGPGTRGDRSDGGRGD